MKSDSRTTNKPDDFTLSLAIVDALPVLFFCCSVIMIAKHFDSVIFLAGAVICMFAGCGKVLWKLLIVTVHRDIRVLNRQLRILLPLGFLIIFISLVYDRSKISFSAMKSACFQVPSVIFFAIGIIGILAMFVYAKKLDGMDVKSNWIEQITNGIAQFAFFMGLLFI